MTKKSALSKAVASVNIDYSAMINQVEIAHSLTATDLDKEEYRKWALSTGVAMYDLMMGGGIQPAWNMIWGGEGAGKTTIVEGVSTTVVDVQIPIFTYWDYEQALDIQKFGNILAIRNKKVSPDQIFGVRNFKDPSKYDLPPLIRYYPHDVGEDFYVAMGALLRRLPDKVCINKVWYLVFPRTKEGQKMAGKNYNKKLYQKYKKYYVEDPAGGRLQAVMMIDSLQAMNPEAQETEDPSKQLAQDASMHAKHIKKVRGKLRRKHCAVLAIGQLRTNPGARFTNPEYSPGGNALKHACDVRNKQTARSNPNGSGPVESEASVLENHAVDQYKYIHVKNEKNKFFTPGNEGWLRFWIDHKGEARGFCPAYDTYQFLRTTGRIINQHDSTMGKKGGIPKKFVVDWPENGIRNVEMTWFDFKALVLYGVIDGYKDELKILCKNFEIQKDGKLHNPRMFASCFEDMKSGRAFELFQSVRAGTFGMNVEEEYDPDEEVEEEDDEDEDEDY